MADSHRRTQLLALKLGALVRDHGGSSGAAVPASWPGGAALVDGATAWVLAEDEPERALGRAMAWARQQGAAALNVIADRATGLLARRADCFVDPPAVWHVDGRALIEAVPEPYPDSAPLDAELAGLADLIAAGGADPAVEHGVLTGEVEGLEVCRAVRDPLTGTARLEVGVGAHDREAFQLLHGDLPPAEALRGVVEAVRPHRRPGAAPHPLNRLAGERILRAELLRRPLLVGAADLRPAPPPVARANVKDAVPCVAAGRRRDGRPLVVVCSVGVDLDVVPFAADARAALDDGAELVIALRPRDVVAPTVALNEQLRRPARIVGVDRVDP